MGRCKKILFRGAVSMGTLLFLVVILALLAPRFIDLKPEILKIFNHMVHKAGGKVSLKRADFSLLPHPCAVIRHVNLSIPEKTSGTIESLTIYLKIIPLLRGNVQLDRIQVDSFDFRTELPQIPPQKKEGTSAFSLTTMEEKTTSVLTFVASELPDLTLSLEKGKVRFFKENKPLFELRDIQASTVLPPRRFKIDLSCTSDLGETLFFAISLDPQKSDGSGHLSLVRFQPQSFINYLFPEAAERIADSQINLDLDLKTKGFKTFQGEIQASVPHLTLYDGHEKMIFKTGEIKGNFYKDKDQTTVSLSRFDSSYPRLNLTGELSVNQALSQARLKLEGKNVDADSTRKAALRLAGKINDVRKVFDIVRSGTVPHITFNAQGNSLKDLSKLENMVIDLSMINGEVFIPKADLDLKKLNGKGTISRGILDAGNLDARIGNSHASEGSVRLGLKGKDAPIHVDALIQADLTELPPILNRFVKNEIFRGELSRVKNVQGKALGRLLLHGTLKNIGVNVDVSNFSLSARYQRLPAPVKIGKGHFLYDKAEVAVKDVTGSMGNSSFSQLSAAVGRGKELTLAVTGAASEIAMDEVYPWLVSFQNIRRALKNFKSVKGTVSLNALDLSGPLLKPANWHFKITGGMRDFVLDLSFFPGPLTVAKGNFEAVPEKLSFTKARAGILDASCGASGNLSDYLKGVRELNLSFEGNLGPEAVQWVSNLTDLPSELRVRPPLSVSNAHLVWERNTKTSFSGNFSVKEGPGVALNLLRNSEELEVKNLEIRNAKSLASFYVLFKKKEIDLKFSGSLEKKTLDHLLKENSFLTGWIQGDFQAHIPMERLIDSTAQGNLQGGDFGHPPQVKAPVKINGFSLGASGNRLTVNSASLLFGDIPLELQGNISTSARELMLDMDLSANGLDWNRIGKLLEKKGENKDAERSVRVGNTPLRGTIRVKSDHFKYGNYTWNPFQADVILSDGGITIGVTEADLCGIQWIGIVKTDHQKLQFDFDPIAKSQDLNSSLACLWDKKGLMNGKFDFRAEISAQEKNGELLKSLEGNLEFKARKGRIYQFNILAKIFALLNVTEIFVGRLPDLAEEGFGYNSITMKGKLRGEKLLLEEGIIDGASMKIVYDGEIDLLNKTINLTVLVAPLRTINTIIEHIPLINHILHGFISIPVQVTGSLADPTVIPLSPSAVGAGLLGILKKTIRLPIKIIELILPKGAEQSGSQ